MNNPFKIGDKVYHAYHGEGTVMDTSRSGGSIYVSFGRSQNWVGVEMTSFNPWPAPNHTRPFEPVLKKGDVVLIKSKDGGIPFTLTVAQEFRDSIQSGAETSWPKSRFTFHRIGEEIKFN